MALRIVVLRDGQPVRGISYKTLTNNWAAYVNVNGKQQTLGHFVSPEEAVAAREAAKRVMAIAGSPVRTYDAPVAQAPTLI